MVGTDVSSRSWRILALALPAMATLIADPLLGLVDTAVVGRLGASQLGALGLAFSVFTALSWIFNFLVFGTTSTVARALGADEPQVAGRRVSHAAQLALVLGVVMGALLFAAAPWLIRAFGAVDALVDPAVTYLRIRAVGTPLLLLGYVGHGAFRGASNTRTPLGIVVIANVVNAVLTFGLVFGAGFGIPGAAWATVAAEAVAVVAFAWRFGQVGLPLAGHGRPGRAQLKVLVVVSRDLFVRTASLLAGLLAVTVAASRLDAQTAAAHQVLYQTFLMISFLMDGLAIAGQAMVGTALGAGNEDEARAVGRELVRWGLLGGAVIAVALIVGGGVLPRVLTDDVAVLAVVGTAWWFAALGHVINGPVFALDGVLMGAEDFAYLRTWTAAAAVTGGLGAFFAAHAGGGLLGLWIAMEAMMLVRLVSLALRVRGSAWSRTGLGLVSGA